MWRPAAALLCSCAPPVAAAAVFPPGPAPVPSRGCSTALDLPVDRPLKMVLPVPDPALASPFREYYLYLPHDYNNTVPLPVVFSFHGYYNSAQYMVNQDKLMWHSYSLGGPFISIHPQADNDCPQYSCHHPGLKGSWNVGGNTQSPGPLGLTCNETRSKWGHYGCYLSCQSGAGAAAPQGCRDSCSSASCVNDTQFFERLLDHVEDALCVDRLRLHITGMSTGGMMAYGMAATFAGRFASALPVAGSALLGFWTPPEHPIALMDIHGKFDTTIPANVSNSFRCPNQYNKSTSAKGCHDYQKNAPHGAVFSNDGMFYTPNPNITSSVAKVNGCDFSGVKPWTTNRDGKAGFRCDQPYGECGEFPVVRCTWDGPHQLPFKGRRYNKAMKMRAKKRAFANIAWQWMEARALPSAPPRQAAAAQPSAQLRTVLPPWHHEDNDDEDDEAADEHGVGVEDGAEDTDGHVLGARDAF